MNIDAFANLKLGDKVIVRRLGLEAEIGEVIGAPHSGNTLIEVRLASDDYTVYFRDVIGRTRKSA